MYGYKLVENRGPRGYTYSVIEKFTDQIIKTFSHKDHSKGKEFLNHLNFGGAFDGNTPTFFLIKTPVCINKANEISL